MAYLIEFHGRLSRPGGPAVAARPPELVFTLHPEAQGSEAPIWTERLTAVALSTDGAFEVVLGRGSPLTHTMFSVVPRWLAIQEATEGNEGPEVGPRTPILGNSVRLASAIDALEARVHDLEGDRGATGQAAVHPPPPLEQARRRIRILHRRLRRVELGGGPIPPLQSELEVLAARLKHLDGEDGRLTRIEDEIEDLVGPDGDLIDILERIEKIEGSGPVPRPAPPSPAPGTLPRMDPRFIAALAERLDALARRLDESEHRSSTTPEVTADSLHAVKRSGDTMTGGLTINRGGLDVVSGGVKCRGAEVNSLEASLFLKAPKVITEGIELRGDLTVDNTKRVLQVRHIEGRAGSGRKDGALELNSRSGEPVVVGNQEQRAGISVHGPATADSFTPRASGIAHYFDAAEALAPGELAALNARGQVVRSTEQAQQLVGVVVAAAAVTTGTGGDSAALVAYAGVVRCRVTGEVHPGDVLVASAIPGRATRWRGDPPPAPGSRLGKALGSARGEAGEVWVLVAPG